MIVPKIPGFTIGTDRGAVKFVARNSQMSARTGKFKRHAVAVNLLPEEAINIACRLILAAWKAQESGDHG